MKSVRALFFGFVLMLPVYVHAAPEQSQDGYACGQDVEREVWRLWDDTAKQLVAGQLVGERLAKQGDVYALYDLQTYLQNLVAMAGRCGRKDRLVEAARLLGPVFAELKAAPRGKGREWICRGGPICNAGNRRLGVEVQLASVQFLGLTSSLAAHLADVPGEEATAFRRVVAETALAHLARWSSTEAIVKIAKKTTATASGDATDPALAFEDKQLWMIAIYANLAYLATSDKSVAAMVRSAAPEPDRFSRHLTSLLELFRARVTVDTSGGADLPSADIDRGFWRANKDNRYAGYSEAKKPVECVQQESGRSEPVVKVANDRPVPLEGSGWDLSHARRLVHALAAIELGRKAMPSVFGIAASALPRSDLRELFAMHLLKKGWNGDLDFPLFSNFWGGANGWYRVDYDNGTGRCREGTPPFGLSIAFATGGYAAWGEQVPKVGQLGRRIRVLSLSDEKASQSFVKQYYGDLQEPVDTLKGVMNRLMFWPSLIYGADKPAPGNR